MGGAGHCCQMADAKLGCLQSPTFPRNFEASSRARFGDFFGFSLIFFLYLLCFFN